jgi:hypothetical protein
MEKTLEISFDPSAQKYYFILPPAICDSLLLECGDPAGLKICHIQKDKLENLCRSLLEKSLAMEIIRDQNIRAAKRKVSSAIAVLLVIVFVIFLKDQILNSYPSLKWPLYIGVPLAGTLSCIVIFLNYINPVPPASALSDTLGLIEIRKRISQEFSC